MNTLDFVRTRLGYGDIPHEMLSQIPEPRDDLFDPSRRTALSRLGYGALGLALSSSSVLSVDYASGQFDWNNQETIVGFVDDRSEARSDRAILFLGGLGAQSSLPKAKKFMDGLIVPGEPDIPGIYVEYPEDEPDKKEVSREVSDFVIAQGINKLSVVAESWAGIMALSVVSEMDEEVIFKDILADCALVEMKNLFRHGDKRWVEFIARLKGFEAGKLASFFGGFTNHEDEHSSFPLDVADRFKAGYNRANGSIENGGGSPKTWLWKVREMVLSDPGVWYEAVADRLADNGTVVTYAGPYDPRNDGRVNVSNAPRSFYVATGRQPQRIYINGGGHTMGPETIKSYQKAYIDSTGMAA